MDTFILLATHSALNYFGYVSRWPQFLISLYHLLWYPYSNLNSH